jgi:hypothetical protein
MSPRKKTWTQAGPSPSQTPPWRGATSPENNTDTAISYFIYFYCNNCFTLRLFKIKKNKMYYDAVFNILEICFGNSKKMYGMTMFSGNNRDVTGQLAAHSKEILF